VHFSATVRGTWTHPWQILDISRPVDLGLPVKLVTMRRQPLPVRFPVRSAPPLHWSLRVESRAATIAAVSLVSAAVSIST
jgi:hypothetical protein